MSTEIVRAAPAPATLPEKMQYAKALASSGMLPAQYRQQPANLLWALEFADSLGLHPMAAITGVHVIEGKPSASAALISALVRRAGHKLRVRGDDARAVAQIIRADDPEFTYECTWTMGRAQQAGLTRKDVWKKYPAAMLKARAITEVAREACEEALSGMHYTPEELGAVVDAEGNPIDAPVMQLHRVQPGEPDPWATPAPQAAGRDFVREARESDDPAQVRQIWKDAKAAGLDEERLGWIEAVGRSLATTEQPGPTPPPPSTAGSGTTEAPATAPATASPPPDEPVVEGVVVPEDDHAAAVADLRALAARLHITDIDTDAHGALGVPLEQAAPSAIRRLIEQMGGAA